MYVDDIGRRAVQSVSANFRHLRRRVRLHRLQLLGALAVLHRLQSLGRRAVFIPLGGAAAVQSIVLRETQCRRGG